MVAAVGRIENDGNLFFIFFTLFSCFISLLLFKVSQYNYLMHNKSIRWWTWERERRAGTKIFTFYLPIHCLALLKTFWRGN